MIQNLYEPFDRGGAEQVVKMTVEGLLSSGHQVVLVTSSPEGPSVVHDGNLTIYRMRPPNIYFYTEAHQYHPIARLVWHLVDIFNLAVSRRVREILLSEKPDIVHTHNLMGLSFLIPRMIQKMGLIHVHTVHDVQLVEPSAMIMKQYEHSYRYSGLPTRLYTSLMKYLFGSPNYVISPSKFLLSFYKERGFFQTSRTSVLRNPMTFRRLVSEEMTEGADKKEGALQCLYLGQIEEHKGIVTLLDAFAGITKEEASLTIAGAGSLLEMVRARVSRQDNMTVLGRVGRNRLPELFAHIDLVVVPSLCYENSPTVIFESFFFGKPVVASAIEGIAELIEEGENGYTVPAGDAGALKERILSCAKQKERLVAMGRYASKTLEEFGPEQYTHDLVALYQSSEVRPH